jgi:DNA processing protein
MDAHDREAAALLTLLHARPGGASWGQLASEVAFEGSAETVLHGARGDALFELPFDDDVLADAADSISRWRRQALRFVTVLDEDYPARLLDIRETPPFLFYEGQLRIADMGLSVVGSRKASEWGRDLAARVAEFLVSEGLTVIAGLAAGIDTVAHRAALDAGGRTVAFIGTGITRAYPKENAGLQREIAESGLVLSQFYPDAAPTKFTFPMRNAAMSGYGIATIIIEAGETSGTRIQARVAREHGRPVILTSKVAETTTWGAAIAKESGVHVVSTMRDLRDAVRSTVDAPRMLDSALAALATS